MKFDFCVSYLVLRLSLLIVPVALEHLVNLLSEEERNLRPSPPEHPKKDLENRKRKDHVRGVKKMLDEERDRGDGEDGEYQAGDEGQEKQENVRPEWDLGLGRRQFAASAVGTGLSIAGVHVKPRAELDVVAPAAEVAK
jgi:hypothetical protein